MYIEDKMFSVLMTEEEYALYSDFLEQREYGFFGALAQRGKAALAGAKKNVWGKMAEKSDGVLHDRLTGQLLDRAASHGNAQLQHQAAARAEAFGGMRNIVKAKQGAQAAGTAVIDAGKATGSAVIGTGKAAYEGAVSSAREAGQALRQTGTQIGGWFGRQAKRVSKTATNLKNSTVEGYNATRNAIRDEANQIGRDYRAAQIRKGRRLIAQYA